MGKMIGTILNGPTRIHLTRRDVFDLVAACEESALDEFWKLVTIENIELAQIALSGPLGAWLEDAGLAPRKLWNDQGQPWMSPVPSIRQSYQIDIGRQVDVTCRAFIRLWNQDEPIAPAGVVYRTSSFLGSTYQTLFAGYEDNPVFDNESYAVVARAVHFGIAEKLGCS